jgi:hypothetical protein
MTSLPDFVFVQFLAGRPSNCRFGRYARDPKSLIRSSYTNRDSKSCKPASGAFLSV